jgi:thioredoxin-related protein
MSNLTERLKRIGIFLLIFIAVLLVVKLVRRVFFPKSPVIASHSGIRIGAPIPSLDIDWSKNQRTLLLALNKDCDFCNASAPFYKRLTQEVAEQGKVRLIAVLPHEVDESRKYLDSMGISVNEIKQVQLNSIGVMGTPALILVDKNGLVTDLWVGKLPQKDEAKMLSRLDEDAAEVKR